MLKGVVYEAHFVSLSMLKYLYASSNTKLAFNISHEWLPPFQLRFVNLSSCKISNGFPQWFRNQTKLVRLSFSATTISGPLPTWLRKLLVIPFINLSHNNLSGSLTNLPSVEAHNDFEYPVLFLQNNRFNESIPWLLCKRVDLYYLDLYRNMLIGKFPYSLKNWQRLRVLSLSSNRLIGVIPSSIGQFPSLT
ncbi:putative non-specific serine/threonine protein kinase [Helianthus anomalus]